MVIDVSGSMEGNPLEIAKKSSASFIGNMKTYEETELVSFNDSQQLVQSFTTDKNQLIDATLGLTSNGGTNITGALLYEINRLKSKSGHKVLFILSDGEDNQFSQIESRAQVIDEANRYGITIFAIGFGAGYETLSEVAEETGGRYIATPNEATLFTSFQEIANSLNNVYKVTYQLESPEKGRHIAKVEYENIYDKKSYLLGEEESNENEAAIPASGVTDNTDGDLDESSSFHISRVKPNTLYKNNENNYKVTLEGTELDSVKGIDIGKVKGKIIEQKQNAITLSLPENLPLGNHLIIVTNDEGKEEQVSFTLSKPGIKDSVQFGWATIYADTCVDNGNSIDCMGNPNIDRFIFPHSSKMSLKNHETLHFNGIKLNIKGASFDFVESLLDTGNGFKMTKNSNGETFNLSNGSTLNFKKYGIEIGSKMKYTAKHDRGAPGTLEATAEFSGLQPLLKHTTLENLDIVNKLAPALGGKYSVGISFGDDSANFKGKVDLKDTDLKIFNFGHAFGAIEADIIKNRYQVDMSLDRINLFGKIPFIGSAIESQEFTFGYEVPFGIRLGVTVEGDYKLGTTGLTAEKAGLIGDFTSKNEQELIAGIGTVGNRPIKMLFKELNSIKIANIHLFDIDEDKATLASVEFNGKLKKMFSSSWEAEAKLKALLLGFTLGEANGRINKDLIQSTFTTDVMNMKGNVTITYQDPAYWNRLTIFALGQIEPAPLIKGNAKITLIPSSIRNSEFEIVAKAGFLKLHKTQDEYNFFH
nr:vWA domain-containing protein [Salirhabdus salicampi]